MIANLAASIHARLLARARARGEDFNLVLTRYGLERFLYRLSVSPARDYYLLKGALLFDLWFDLPHRPTRDADFLGFGAADRDALRRHVRDVCALAVDDGIAFDPESVSIEEIRDDAKYGGLRVKLVGLLGRAHCPVQLDVGYGDAVTPEPEEITYPCLLEDLPPPKLKVYPRASVVAEKLEAIATLGIANSRMKDYFDLRALAREGAVGQDVLEDAIAATFERRGTVLPAELPLGLTDAFAQNAEKRAQWNAFLRKNGLEAPALVEVVAEVRDFLAMPLRRAWERSQHRRR